MRIPSMELTTSSSPTWTDARGIEHLNFAWAEAHYMKAPISVLLYTVKDCREAIQAMPEGRKAGVYMDTIHVINRILVLRGR